MIMSRNITRNTAIRSQRMTVLLTPEAKAIIEARARTLGITSSELARRAIEAYDPHRDEQALRLLAAELAAVVDQTEAKLDATLAELDGLRRYFAGVDAEARRGGR
jgi:hypothetical protein